MDNSKIYGNDIEGLKNNTGISSTPPSFQPELKERKKPVNVTELDVETIRRKSLLPNIIRCVKSNGKVPTKVVAGMLSVALAVGAYFVHKDSVESSFDAYDAEVALAATDTLKDVINDNKFIDESGDHYWYDSVKIGETYRDMINSDETDSYSVAYAIKNNLNHDFERDEVSTIYDVVFGMRPDTYAFTLGFLGYDDPAFEKYLAEEIAKKTTKLDAIDQMMDDYAQSDKKAESSKDAVSGLGGEK